MRAFQFLVLCGCLFACGERTLASHPCPENGSTLTYQNFGERFFTSYCVACHGGPHGHSSRAFNTLTLIQASRERIFTNATGENPPMPPGPDDPAPEELAKLSEWLSCGAP